MSAALFQQLPADARLLFIRLRNLGEAVLDTASLRALKKWRPDLHITTLVEEIYTDLYAADPDIEAMALPRKSSDKRSSLLARINVIRELRRRKFSAAINLHGGPTSAQLTFLSGAKHCVGAAHFRQQYAYNLRVPPAEQILQRDRETLHTVESQFAWFQWLGLPDDKLKTTRLFVASPSQATAAKKLSAAGIELNLPYAVLAPTNEFDTKRWMPERYAEIARHLIELGVQIVMTGAPTNEQRAQLEAVQQASRNRLVSLSDLTIGELMSVIAGGRVFVGNDSGPAHMAAALQIPLVVLFGPASSVRWRPWHSAPAEVVQNHFTCNPCSMYTCHAFAEPECIRSITTEQVIRAVERVMSR
jgi:predicted lipopolysaccharide heptosyltransferase III